MDSNILHHYELIQEVSCRLLILSCNGCTLYEVIRMQSIYYFITHWLYVLFLDT
jgi:hypothetical protein